MTDRNIMINLHDGIYLTVQEMRRFLWILEKADRRDYITEKDIRIMRQALDSIVVDYEDIMQALAKAGGSIE